MTVPILVLGLGNELFTDEGVGIEAARTIATLDLDDVEVVDGGTLGLDLVPTLADRRSLLVLDAMVSDGASPGDILTLDDATVRSARKLLMSAHQLGLSEALAAADLWGRGPAVCAGVGMVPFDLGTGYGLSPGARSGLPALVDEALSVLDSWGVKEPASA